MTRLLLHTAVATALAAGTLGLAQPARTSADAASSDRVHTVRVPDGDPHERSLDPRTTEPFSLIGVTWDDPDAVLDGTAQVRTRSRESGAWSAWSALDTDVRAPEAGPDRDRAGVRGGTQPLWTGPSDGVEVRVSGGGGCPRGCASNWSTPTAGRTPCTARSSNRTPPGRTPPGRPPARPPPARPPPSVPR
ncbi:hypothetical protein [Streptomyces afghaniensis]|uniref:hypothetical protein n=1 Tax=Streptomyces afghaniensis TaxID=66865 RepID=UPI002787558A|nr:hypothetical protein [Streptomyces afghaniensis]MDQ1016815.1 hypothetical protein [Streptomyces afghaniensis]